MVKQVDSPVPAHDKIVESKTVTLIDGRFDTEDARDLLTDIFSLKTNYLRIKNLRSWVQCGNDDGNCHENIARLEAEMKKLQETLNEAKVKGKPVLVHAEVKIQLADQA
ncbi:MAG TPA: hypothetical protein VGD40_25035 [Chryseosolibacter sp.]